MRCPECEKGLRCGCNSCRKHSPNRENNMIHSFDENDVAIQECPYCGYKQTIDFWYEWQFACLDESECMYRPMEKPPSL